MKLVVAAALPACGAPHDADFSARDWDALPGERIVALALTSDA